MHLTHKVGAALAVAVLGLALRSASAQTPYTFTTLDNPLAGSYTNIYGTQSGTEIFGINASGEAVGFYFDSAGMHAFTKTLGGGFTTLPDPGIAGSTGATGINNMGQIVGGYGDGTSSYGFLYTPGAGFQKISDTAITSANGYTTPFGVNDAGQIVGLYAPNGTSQIKSFVYTPGPGGTSTYTDFADPKATGSTFAYGINNLGQIAGEYAPSPGFQTGFVFTPGSGFSDIVDPNAPKHTLVSGINSSGQVAGYYFKNTGQRGFVETPGFGGAPSTFSTLYDPAAASDFTVRGINDAGQVVGYYLDTNSVYHGFIATPAAVPEVSSVASFGLLMLMGMSGFWTVSRRRTKAAA